MGQPGNAVIVVDGYSSGAAYPASIRKRGLVPVHVRSGTEKRSPRLREAVEHVLERLSGDYAAAEAFDGDLGALAGRLDALKPVAVVAGAESGVTLTDALAERLGLAGNGAATSEARREKYVMQRAVAAAGLRSIESLRTGDLDELLTWAQRRNRWPVIVKPLSSAGTDGVCACASPRAVEEAFRALIGNTSFLGDINSKVLAQECVTGRELVINAVSRDGAHLVTDVWEYAKIRESGGAPLYDATRLVRNLGAEHTIAIDYARRALDALGVRFGPSHMELMLTADGPVLIECAARPMGGGFPPDLVEEALGYTQVELVVESIADPTAFRARFESAYRPRRAFMMKSLISAREGDVYSVPAINLLRHLPSVRRGDFVHVIESGFLPRTVDLLSSGASLFLIHEDDAVVDRDYALIREMETESQNGLFELSPQDEATTPDPDWFKLLPDETWLKPEESCVADAAAVVKALDLGPGLDVLDCPCGDARFGVHLARTGIRMTGVDINPRFIAKARERFRDAGIDADLHEGDMRALPYDEDFDVVVNWFNSFGYFGVEDDFETLLRFARALRPGGRLLLEAPNRAAILANTRTLCDGDGKPMSKDWDDWTERMIARPVVSGPDGERTVVAGVRMYSLTQYRQMFRLAGLDFERVWGEELSAFTERSKRMILLARKPAAT